MIDSKELMIGSWVHVQRLADRVYQRVTSIYSGHVNEYHQDFITPIPLTEEILAKCGFRRCTLDRAVFHELRINKTTKLLFSLGVMSLGVEGVAQYHWHHMNTQHLHQLQNLFYCLTQTELKIDL